METRTLGRSGISVSRLCLGTMMFGGPTDAATSDGSSPAPPRRGSTSSTPPMATMPASPRRWSAPPSRRTAMPGCWRPRSPTRSGKGPNEGGLSRKWVIQGAEACLRRLGTDYVDILYLHKEDHATPLETTVRALGDLVRAGKIRHFGVSNYRSWRIAEVCRLCDQLGIDRPIVSQPYYNAMNRQPEVEQLPAAAHYGLGIFPYSPLARGVLTGEIPPRRGAGARQPRRPAGPPHAGDRAAAGIAGDRPAHPRPRRRRAAPRRRISQSTGCCTTAWSPAASSGRGPRRIWRTTWRRSPTASPPRTRRWSIRWWRLATPRPPATTTRNIRSRAASRQQPETAGGTAPGAQAGRPPGADRQCR